MHDEKGHLPWFVIAAISGASFEVAVYLLTTLIEDRQVTISGMSNAALQGALVGVAFGALGKGIQVLKTAIKASSIGKKAFSLSSQAISKALSNPSRLQHAYKHAKDFGFGNWNKTTAKQWECFIKGNLMHYTKKFSATLGNDAVTGYYRCVNGTHIATYIYKNGKYKGQLATVVRLSREQMTKYKLW